MQEAAELAGGVCLVAAAFFVALPLGLAVLGVLLVLVGNVKVGK